jgi:hypothetical protein
LTLGYSKDLDMHKAAMALYFGIYNLVRKHKTLGTTPTVAAGVEESRWTLEMVVEMAEAYWKPRHEAQRAVDAAIRRANEHGEFARAFAEAGL